MGGSAFATILNPNSFPRMPPTVYAAVKNRLFPQLENLYQHVAVPFEAPEKTSYGDVDFVVAGPKIGIDSAGAEVVGAPVNVAHALVQEAIGARYTNPQEGNRTSNFAVPIAKGGWGLLNHGREEDEARRAVSGGDIFYQESQLLKVDVNVCADKAEFERIVFYHAYGDLGMIMGLVGRNAGLRLGEKGLRIPNSPNPPVELSQSFDDITKFMGWSMDAWKAGFRTKRDVFEWAGSSRFFHPDNFRTHGDGIRKVKAARTMYGEFVEWASDRAALGPPTETVTDSKLTKEEEWLTFRDQTLAYFDKKEEFEALTHERTHRARSKEVFNGTKVRDWADLGEHWMAVKLIMDTVREKYGGEAGVLKLYDEEGEQGVKRIVLEAKEQLEL
ncbi:hypothetical protein FPV67DRAFT_1376021, partial [Lyophyllum atratum]